MPLRDLLSIGDESEVLSDLSSSSCVRDPDVEDFLLRTAVPYEKAHKARTYLIIDPPSIRSREVAIVAYFSIALKCFHIGDGVSITMRRRLNGIFQNDILPCYLLGQVGKNDRYADMIKGKEIVDLALNLVLDAHERVGGRFISVDCKDSDGLLRFYQESGFAILPSKGGQDHHRLVRFI